MNKQAAFTIIKYCFKRPNKRNSDISCEIFI